MRSRSPKIQPRIVVAWTRQTDCEPVVRLMASPWQGFHHKIGGPESPSAPLTSEYDLTQVPYRVRTFGCQDRRPPARAHLLHLPHPILPSNQAQHLDPMQ